MSWNEFLFWDAIFWGVGFGMGWLVSKWTQQSAIASLPSKAIAAIEAPEMILSEQLAQTQLAYQLAIEMSQFRASFLAQTSHELRSPLNSVISLHQLIMADLCDDPAEEREFVTQAHTAALKMLARLDELIQISKIESGTSPPQFRILQLAEMLEEIRALTYLQAQNRSLRLEVSLPDPSVYVMADPRWLRQVLINLVTTPIALMQEGSIRLSTQVVLKSEQPESKQVQILIEDQRPIASWQEADLPIVTDLPIVADVNPTKLKQSARSPNPLPSAASGLDLTINQKLMQAMGGELKVLATASEQGSAAPTSLTQAIPLTQICCLLPLVSPEQVELIL